MPKDIAKTLSVASTSCASGSKSENGPLVRYPVGNVFEAGQTERMHSPRALPAVAASSYLIGLDDKPGAALLAASVRDVLIRIGNVCGITGLSVPTIYRQMSKGTFPRPVKITASARAWKLSEVTAWVDGLERGNAS
jgi:prophage regulatory protein